MRIYLVQHGKAKTKEEDPDRHLTEDGLAEVERVGEFIRPLGVHVEAVWHSGKARAVETAEVLARVVKADHGAIARDGLAPNDQVDPVIRELERSETDVMIVGHLPFLSKLAAKLLVGKEASEIVAFKNSGVVCLESDKGGVWRLIWAIVPDLIRGAQT